MDRRLKVSALFVAMLVIAIDQSTKWWALTALRHTGGHLALPGPVDLTFNFNESNAFGLNPIVGHANRWFLMSVNLFVAALLLWVILVKQVRPPMLFGLALIMAGALGNGLDRLLIGAVVDFLDATKVGFVWVFNVADVTLDVGIGLIMLNALLSERRAAT